MVRRNPEFFSGEKTWQCGETAQCFYTGCFVEFNRRHFGGLCSVIIKMVPPGNTSKIGSEAFTVEKLLIPMDAESYVAKRKKAHKKTETKVQDNVTR